MPQRYVSIKESLVAKGASVKAAKTKAAKIYNATRKSGEKPVTRHYDDDAKFVARMKNRRKK